MSEDIVKLKGTKTGLQISFAPGVTFQAIEKNIKRKLESGSGFFMRGTVVEIAPNLLRHADWERLRVLFRRHGIVFRMSKPSVDKPADSLLEEAAKKKKKAREREVEQMVVVDRTLRGGQEIRTESSVLVCGNVNPGAQIIAGGSIDIRGTCRGLVHAGAFGNSKAFIIADRLMPRQIRIANFIARSPDQPETSDKAERASIKDGQIVIEPIER